MIRSTLIILAMIAVTRMVEANDYEVLARSIIAAVTAEGSDEQLAANSADVPPIIRLPGKRWKPPAGWSMRNWLVSRGVPSCELRGMTNDELDIVFDNWNNWGITNSNGKFNADNLPQKAPRCPT